MTRWQFDDGSTVETVANDSSSVTYEISSLSTDHTGVYYCEAIIDGMTDISMNYTLNLLSEYIEFYFMTCTIVKNLKIAILQYCYRWCWLITIL